MVARAAGPRVPTALGRIRGAGLLLAMMMTVGWVLVLEAQESRLLLEGDSLVGWRISEFASPGPVEVRDGRVVLGRGDPLTGVTWAGDFPRTGYEITLEAMRLEGSDFFSAITFPVGEDHCTLMIGGWGGSVVGLSSLEGADASENETSRWIDFENGRWYRIRLRVTDERIQAWIDDDQVVDLYRSGRLLSTRIEVLPSRPFGIATWQTAAAIRDIRLREIRDGSRAPSASAGTRRP